MKITKTIPGKLIDVSLGGISKCEIVLGEPTSAYNGEDKLTLRQLPPSAVALLTLMGEFDVEIVFTPRKAVVLAGNTTGDDNLKIDCPIVYLNGSDIRVNGTQIGTADDADTETPDAVTTVDPAWAALPVMQKWTIERDTAIAEGRSSEFEQYYGDSQPTLEFLNDFGNGSPDFHYWQDKLNTAEKPALVDESADGVVEIPADTTSSSTAVTPEEPAADTTVPNGAVVQESDSGVVEIPVDASASATDVVSAAHDETPRDDIGDLPIISDEELASATSSVSALTSTTESDSPATQVVDGGSTTADPVPETSALADADPAKTITQSAVVDTNAHTDVASSAIAETLGTSEQTPVVSGGIVDAPVTSALAVDPASSGTGSATVSSGIVSTTPASSSIGSADVVSAAQVNSIGSTTVPATAVVAAPDAALATQGDIAVHGNMQVVGSATAPVETSDTLAPTVLSGTVTSAGEPVVGNATDTVAADSAGHTA